VGRRLIESALDELRLPPHLLVPDCPPRRGRRPAEIRRPMTTAVDVDYDFHAGRLEARDRRQTEARAGAWRGGAFRPVSAGGIAGTSDCGSTAGT